MYKFMKISKCYLEAKRIKQTYIDKRYVKYT